MMSSKRWTGNNALLLVLFVPTGTQGLNNFTIVEVSIAVKFFTETGLLALCSNPQPGEYHFGRILRHAWATVGLFFSPVTTRGGNNVKEY
jgi:hypothetical protein